MRSEPTMDRTDVSPTTALRILVLSSNSCSSASPSNANLDISESSTPVDRACTPQMH